MKLLTLCAALCVVMLSAAANAYHVRDVRAFDEFFPQGQWKSWTYQLSDYGFDPARDRLTGPIVLVLSLRGFSGEPCENYDAQPFIFGGIGQGRIYGRACEDLVLRDLAAFEDDGSMTVGITVDADALFRFASLDFDFVPGPSSLPEPAGIGLMALALVALAGWRKRRG